MFFKGSLIFKIRKTIKIIFNFVILQAPCILDTQASSTPDSLLKNYHRLGMFKRSLIKYDFYKREQIYTWKKIKKPKIEPENKKL